jgi:hypothetical protein
MLCCLAAAASAAGPARVSVRVEGQSGTVTPQVGLTTTARPVVKDGNSQHSCTGTSVAGALERATAGDWTGPYYGGLGYSVYTIKGEKHDFSLDGSGASTSWALWVNNKFSQTGACATELQTGDEVLFFVDRCAGATPGNNYTCQNPPVLPLGLNAPSRVRAGRDFKVRVVRYDTAGHATPVAGAAVTGGDESAISGADGVATVRLTKLGLPKLSATREGSVRTAGVPVCVTREDGSGSCPPDPRAPDVRLLGIRSGQSFRSGHGPRELRGRVRLGLDGLRDVRLRLTRRNGHRCQGYDGRLEAFRHIRHCTDAGSFSAADRTPFSYLLPRRLPAGRYLLEGVAVDKHGRRSRLRRGVSRLTFTVR